MQAASPTILLRNFFLAVKYQGKRMKAMHLNKHKDLKCQGGSRLWSKQGIASSSKTFIKLSQWCLES
ncbi:hypothetical protein V6N11_007904 [Hibiscus sabdariffa]|uniref:Uncharacterized protein n=1 Tax=Hibiscus sabdariffa TaxID=183260 RepID=A0ABR2PZ12_9ROSI